MLTVSRFPFRKSTAGTALLAFALASTPHPAGAAPAAAGTSPLVIQHDPLACVTTAAPPVVDASVTPPKDLDKGFVYFRAAGTEDYYYVLMAMTGAGAALEALLPRPLPETKGIDYYLQTVDRADLRKKTPDYQPPVVKDNVCKSKKPAAVPKEGAQLTVGLTREGAAPIPPGFNAADIAKVILVTGAVVTVAVALHAAAAAGGSAAAATSVGGGAGGASAGGISTGVLVGGGVAVAAGAAIVVANNRNKGTTDQPPTITISGVPTSGSAPLPVTFTATVTDKENDTPYTVNWNFGDGTTGTGMTAIHTYDKTGTFTATATATDSKGKVGTSNSVSISIPEPSSITAAISWSGHATVTLEILDASGNSVGQPFPPAEGACGTDANQTYEVVLQGSSLVGGTYTVKASATVCPSGTPPSTVLAVGNVVTATGDSECSPQNVTIPVDGSFVTVCSFSIS